jgi:lysophospholipase L1-like esterase
MSISAERVADANLSVIYLGDSNLWIGGDDCSGESAWSHWFNSIPGVEGVSYARSGATWTNTSVTVKDTDYYTQSLDNQNVIYNEVMRLVLARDNGQLSPLPDVIFVSAGTNDAWFNAKRPGIFDVTAEQAVDALPELRGKAVAQVTSLAESVVYSLDILDSAFPESTIILLTPPETTATTVEMVTKVSDIIAECGALTKHHVIRLDKLSGISSAKEKKHHRLTSDGTHTSPQGAKKIASVVEKELKDLGVLKR